MGRSSLARLEVSDRRPRSRLWLAVAATVVVLTAAVGLVAGTGGLGSSPAATPAGPLSFATVQRADLVATQTLAGVVSSTQGEPVINRLQGTLTGQAPTGSRIERGEELFSVNGYPVVLFFGTLPAWRTLEEGVAPGPDVRQLEENLRELGFSPGTVDDHFTSATAAAVRAWQSSMNQAASGVVRLGEAVFLQGPATIARQVRPTGSPVRDGEEVLQTRTETKTVSVTLEAGEQDLLAVGDRVVVTRAGERFEAEVSSVETREEAGGQTSVMATATPDDPAALAGVRDGASARVEVVTGSRSGVLVVPVTALLAQVQGGYAIQVDRDGRIVLVEVEPGLFGDDDLLEVSGELREGDRVVVP